MPLQDTPSTSSTPNGVGKLETFPNAVEIVGGRDATTDFEIVQKSINVATGQDLLAELEKRQRVMHDAPDHNYLAVIDGLQKSIHAVAGGGAFAKQRKDMGAMLGRSLPNSAAESGCGALPSGRRQPARTTAETARLNNERSVLSSVTDLGAIVRQKRKDMGLTQQRFADLTGVGRRFILELEAGKPTLEFGRVLKVCQSIGIDLTVLQR